MFTVSDYPTPTSLWHFDAASKRLEVLSTSRRNPKTESLAERAEAFAVERDSCHYSAPIETSRATKIRTALNRILSD